jgi:hypothetical protein
MGRMERRVLLVPLAPQAPPVNLGSLDNLVRLVSVRAKASIK